MTTIGPGVRVMLVGTDGYMPPIGVRGVVVSEVDRYGDCDVLFPGHPCPVPPGTTWAAHWTWLLPLDGGLDRDDQASQQDERPDARCDDDPRGWVKSSTA